MEGHALDSSSSVVSKSRLEFLVDGIFAIAMTILVLDLKVPELADGHSVAELARGLGLHASTFFSYLLSFFMLGMMWYRHNQHYRHLQRITGGMLVLHLVQLAMAAFFPFCAALFGRYPINHLSMVLYTGCILVYQSAAIVEWRVALRARAVTPQLSQADRARYGKRHVRAIVLLSFVFLYSLVTSIWP